MASTNLGIGAAICDNLAAKGCSLLMNYTSPSSTQKTADLATHLQDTHSVTAIPVQADMGSESGPAHLVSVAKNHFSHPKTGAFTLSIIINNAGVAQNRSISEIDSAEFARQYNVNVRGPLLLMQAAEPYLPHDRSGRVVNLSSVSSSLGFPRQSIYGGTKAALEAMTRTWSRELSERATVNAVNPGPVATDMYGGNDAAFQEQMSWWMRNTPLARVREGIDREEFVRDAEKNGGRPGYEGEIAGIVGMLVGEESAWCTGSVICANGGFKMST
ncbi:MAG: hypothetical protein Q9157_003945 [Trypethelium eluteriae]